jgi:chromosomal replication initiator protein
MTLEGVNFWPEVLSALSIKLNNPLIRQLSNITKANYNISLGTVTVEAPNSFIKDHLSNYTKDIKQIIKDIMVQDTDVLIVVNDKLQDSGAAARSKLEDFEQKKTISKKNRSNFIPRFTFENFVVGSNNQFAHASCLSVAARPCKSYNPLFIFGCSGLGKTHLLHAIGNYVCEYFPDLKVIYINGERFLSEYIKSIRTKTTDAFRKKFREDYDIILIDDVQFIAGKGQSQEELFHTISYAQDNNKQIVIASDKFPDEIEGLDKRLRTRFSSGLVCDVKAPELETRIAIIKNKTRELNINIPQDACIKLAEIMVGSVRELEGAVNSIGAYASFANTPITSDFIEETYTKKLANIKNKKIDVEMIVNKVAAHFDISPKEIMGSNRNKDLVLPRHVSIYIAKKLMDRSVSEIAKSFNKKNHSTVIHALEKMEEAQKSDQKLKGDIDHIITELKK